MVGEAGFQLSPIPDETFLGLVATIGLLLGAENYRDAYGCITGRGRITPANLLPRNGRAIARFLPDRFQQRPELICYEHTAFPYFSAFSPQESKSTAIAAMLEKNDLGARSALGLAATPFSEHRFMRHCPMCAKEQWAVYGRTTWIRSHQLPGVDVCHRHGISLIESRISTVKLGIHTEPICLPENGADGPIMPIWESGEPWNKSSPEHLVAQISHQLLCTNAVTYECFAKETLIYSPPGHIMRMV